MSENNEQDERTDTKDAWKGKRGFQDPETRKKAMERSLETRRKSSKDTVLDFFHHESSEPVEPISEETIQALQKIHPTYMPTANQLKILAMALSLEHGSSIRHWFRSAGLNRNDWYKWIQNPDFVSWWNKAYAKGIEQYRTTWLSIGLRKMHYDFDYWKAMGEKIFNYISKIAIAQDKTPEEEELTKELLDLVKGINRTKKERTIDIEVKEIEEGE